MMQFTRYGNSSGSPLANALVIVAGTVLIGVSIVLGFFAFLLILGVVLISSAVLAVRMWWLRRSGSGTASNTNSNESPSAADGTLIEGEYRVVENETGRHSSADD